MAAAASFQHVHPTPGRSDHFDFGLGHLSGVSYQTPSIADPVNSRHRLAASASARLLNNAYASSPASSRSFRQPASRSTSRSIADTNMSSQTSTMTLPAATIAWSGSRQRLHKRGSSSSTLTGAHSHFSTPYATYEEPFAELPTTSSPTPTSAKIKPYLRKMSANTKEDADQGRLDLSKSMAENSALAGLGISSEFGSRSASDVTFTTIGRRTQHTRTTSVGSQMSTASGSLRSSQPFVHPMRQTPNRAYTPPAEAEPPNTDYYDTHESSNTITADDLRLTQTLRGQSTPLSSAQTALRSVPTPLYQSHSAADLSRQYASSPTPHLPTTMTRSTTNLSLNSSASRSKSRLNLTRLHTDTSNANTNASTTSIPLSPSSRRASIDKAISFVSHRRSTGGESLDPATRDERIRAARRKFEEKEAVKERRAEERKETRREKSLRRGRRKSGAGNAGGVEEVARSESRKSRRSRRRSSGAAAGHTREGEEEKADVTALTSPTPSQKKQAREHEQSESAAQDAEKSRSTLRRQHESSRSGWQRLTKLLTCGLSRRSA